MSKWEKLKSKKIYENQWISVDEDQVIRPDGTQGQYSVINSSEVVTIVAFDSEGKIFFVHLHRYPHLTFSWEVVKGRTDGEDPKIAAARELQEETGHKASELVEIGKFFPLNGLVRETTYVFIANGLTKTGQNDQAEEGIDQVEAFTWREIEEMIMKNEITDGQTISALYKVKLYLENKNG